jgi:hypothetical protein
LEQVKRQKYKVKKTESEEFKAPNSKHQITNKHQAPMTKTKKTCIGRRVEGAMAMTANACSFLTHLLIYPSAHLLLRLGYWNLELGICLEFGICDLEFKSYERTI